MASSFFRTSLYSVIFPIIFIFPAFSSSSNPTISYSDHCSSIVPESTPRGSAYLTSLPYLRTSYITGGDQLLGKSQPNQTYYSAGKYIRLQITRNCHETTTKGVYKIDAFLILQSPYYYYSSSRGNYSSAGSYYHKNNRRRRGITFSLNGFWSEISRKLCLVGSASSLIEGGKTLHHNAVLKLNYTSENPNMYTSIVRGILESLNSANDGGYFDSIFMFNFPVLSNYNYSLVSEELNKGLLKDFTVPKIQSLSLDSDNFCSLSGHWVDLMRLLPGDDNGLILPHFLSLKPIQCSWEERKMRFLTNFQNNTYYDHKFGLDWTLIGEASWDDKNNEWYVVLCRILNTTSNDFWVGDCSMRLSLRYPSVWTIVNDARIVGELWSTKGVDEIGYFKKIDLMSSDRDGVVSIVPGRKYEYTETERVRKLCPVKKKVKKGDIYPDGNSNNMRFDMSVENSKGKRIAWGYSTPLSVGDKIVYERGAMVVALDTIAPVATSEAEIITQTETVPLNISYKIRINPFESSTLNWSKSLEITAEGEYDAKMGYLCMVGCRKLLNSSHDCEVLVRIDFSPLNNNRGGGFIKGTITSTRSKSDSLYFDGLSFFSAAFYPSEAKRSIWRMDLEITMVLISNTLSCIFIVIQLFHVKKNPEVLSSISLVMLLILCVGNMIPLILNFEAVFFENHSKQTVVLSNGNWLEANEVTVRVITMVAFLLQIRLLQLVWTAKQSEDRDESLLNGEKKSALILLPLYIFGAVITLLLNRTRKVSGASRCSLWGDLRSYAGLILDGFLLPQIVRNTFSGSGEKALSHSFYVGTSAIRLVPHAYDQYRLHNYPTYVSNETYYYANPKADFYSTSWDVVITCGVIVFAVVVFVQQSNGGRWILPRRFREVELYEKVPVIGENE